MGSYRPVGSSTYSTDWGIIYRRGNAMVRKKGKDFGVGEEMVSRKNESYSRCMSQVS